MPGWVLTQVSGGGVSIRAAQDADLTDTLSILNFTVKSQDGFK